MAAFYGLFIRCMFATIRMAALFKRKAALLIDGQKNTRNQLEILPRKQGVRHWFHCASLGEFEQGRPLMEALKKQDPGCEIVLTFFSPSGYEIRKNYPIAAAVMYLLPDTVENARLFVDKVAPDKVYFIKYEFWPNHMQAITKAGIPLYSVCCRFRHGQRFFGLFGGFFRRSLEAVTVFFHQDETSMSLIAELALPGRSVVVGDMRFDRVTSSRLEDGGLSTVAAFAGEAPLMVVGSSWPPEEEIVKNYLLMAPANCKVVLAPHDVSEGRLAHIERLLAGMTQRYSEAEKAIRPEVRVLLVDSIGLLGKIYRHAHFALVGGGYSGKLHNVLEPAACAASVVFGPRISKFPEAEGLVAAGGAFAFVSTQSAAEWLAKMAIEPGLRKCPGVKAQQFVEQNQGATQRIMALLADS